MYNPKIFLIITAFLLFSSAFGQYRGGMELGGNIMTADFTIGEDLDTSGTWGIRLGYVAEYFIADPAYMRGALLINQRGFSFADERWGLNVIDLPLGMGFSPSNNNGRLRWFLDGNFHTEYNFRAFTKIDGELTTLDIGGDPDDIKQFSFGISAGTGLRFSNSISLRLTYYRGLTNLVRGDNDQWKNEVIGLSFLFFFSG